LVIDVTRRARLDNQKFQHLFNLTRRVVESRGWRYELAHEPPRIEYANIRFLAGYRRPWLFDDKVVTEVRFLAESMPELVIGEIASGTTYPKRTALPALMHLLWRQDLTGGYHRASVTSYRGPGSVVTRRGQRALAAVPVGVGTTFAYDGETVTIIKMTTSGHGDEVLVEDRGGKQRYQLALRELLAAGRASIITAGDGPSADDDIEVAGVILANLTQRQLTEVTEKADHVREVLTGYKTGSAETALPSEPRPQYAPDLSLARRYDAKAQELDVSDRTIRRWAAAYRDHGEAGLASLICKNPLGRTDPRWLQTAAEIMTENALLSQPNKKNILLQTRARLDLAYGPDVVPSPPRTTAYKRLNQLDRRLPTFTGSRVRNRDVAVRVDREYGRLQATRPGEFMVMDTNSLDVDALDPVTLRYIKVEITAAMDAYTRCIVGLRVTPTTKSLDVAATMFQAFRPLPAPKNWPDYAVWPEHGIPRAVFPDVEGWKVALAAPRIRLLCLRR
jgi:transposase InsO family protein